MEKALILPNGMRDPFSFEEILGLQDIIFNEAMSIDLSRISFIEPYSMISLLLLGRNYLRSRGEKLRIVNMPLAIHQYLNRMDFFSTGLFEVTSNLNEKYMLKRSNASSRLIEIIEIPNKERKSIAVINTVIALFRKRASNILKYWINESVIDYFVTVISELCQNIFEHSLDSGYLSMQTYTVGSENIFRLVISDSGVGIRGSFENNRSDISYESTAHLIEMALTRPISSKREFGFGLCQVNTIIKMMKGSIYIRSDDASVTAMYQKIKPGTSPIFLKNDLNSFGGTQISISLFA